MPNIRPCKFTDDGHVYAETETGVVYSSATQIIESVGLLNYNGISKAVLEFKSTIGLAVHDTTVLYDRGENLEEYDIDPRVALYVSSYTLALQTLKWKPILVEHGPFLADVNGMTLGFKLDRVFLDAKQEILAEIKCTSEHHPAHAIQLAIYDLCLGERKRKRVSILCRPDGKIADLKTYDDPNDYNVAIAALAVNTWRRNHKLL